MNKSLQVLDAGAIASARAYVESFEHDADRLEVALFEVALLAIGASKDVQRLLSLRQRENRRKANARWTARRNFCVQKIREWLRTREAQEPGRRARRRFQAWLDAEYGRAFPNAIIPDRKTWHAWWREARKQERTSA